jgi:hypothetical protein
MTELPTHLPADRAARVVAALLRLPLVLCAALPMLVGVSVKRAPGVALLFLLSGGLFGLGVGALVGAAGWRRVGVWALGGMAAGSVAFLGGFVVLLARRQVPRRKRGQIDAANHP